MPTWSGLYQQWWFITIVLCTYGFFKEMRPSEPFLTETIIKYNNVSAKDVSNSIYPVWTYSYLSLLVLVFLFTDFLRYKPVIVFEACGYIATWSLLIWGSGVRQLQLMEFFYGIATSTEVAYYTYIYAKVEDAHYQRVTGYVRAAVLLGRFMSGVLSQALVSSKAMNLFQLNYVSFASVCVAFVVALILPGVQNSFYFYRQVPELDARGIQEDVFHDETRADETENIGGSVPESSRIRDIYASENAFGGDRMYGGDNLIEHLGSRGGNYVNHANAGENSNASPASSHALIDEGGRLRERTASRFTSTTCRSHCRLVADYLLADFVASFSTPSVVSWSTFWALTTCGFYQVGNYIQPLWQQISHSHSDLYNGIVEASSTLLGAAAALLVGHLPVSWEARGKPLLAVCALVSGALLLAASFTTQIAVAYVTYAAFRVIYQMCITICSFRVARLLPAGCFGLVFGVNTFVALLLETVLTLVVSDKHGLDLRPRAQFQVYGGYFIVLGVGYTILLVCQVFRRPVFA